MTESTSPLRQLLDTKPIVVADGAMGTNLFALGLANGDCGEIWNVEEADKVRSIHQSMVDAGSDIILTNTFGCNRYRLELHKSAERARELNIAGVKLAREVADSVDRPVIVAGSVGPTGDVLEPLGTRTQVEAEDAFTEQMQAMADAGADVIWIETIFAENELNAAITAVQRVDIDYVSTMTFDTAGKTMMGLTPVDAGGLVAGLGRTPVAFGANCGVGPAQMLDTLFGLNQGLNGAIPAVTKCNCGVPQMGTDLKIHYSGTPQIMGDYARLARDAGARIIGGCCGTTAEHIRAMVDALESSEKGDMPTLAQVEEILGELNPVSNEDPVASSQANAGRKRGGRRGRRSS